MLMSRWICYFCIHVAHGTFIGSTRLEPHKPTQLPLDTTISFGASTRSYTLRERPQAIVSLMSEGDGDGGEVGEGGALLGLPDLDNEVDVSCNVIMLLCFIFSLHQLSLPFSFLILIRI